MLRYEETDLVLMMHMEQLHTFIQLEDKVHRFTHKGIRLTKTNLISLNNPLAVGCFFERKGVKL